MKLFNNPFSVEEHQTGSGTQRLYKFDNGYGASVVRFVIGTNPITGETYGSYTDGDDEWELAVINFTDEGFRLVYDTPITDDVLGHLTEDDVEKTLVAIKAL